MALEPGGGSYSVSPTSSGRASPIPRKLARRRGEDELIPKDKTYRRYAAGVDRALSLFETAFEDWADYISFLGRLLKSLQAHPPNLAIVPSKGLVAKRLAQCLNPELPSGVHQKALEIYNFIFTMIGKDALSRDLTLYLPGLSSTLSFASLSVRTPFLALLELHFLRLDPNALRPAMKAIILALLPGLEEETSEDFEKTLRILDGFKSAIHTDHKALLGPNESSGEEYFWQCFFLASITSSSKRLGALAYMTRYLPKLGGSFRRPSSTSGTNGADHGVAGQDGHDSAAIVTSPEPGLLLRCFAAGLGDDQILIQRGYLDLLVTHLPLHAKVLQTRVKAEDLELLMIAASGVVARRDMSLNRRLWTWLLGPEPVGGPDGDGMESPMSVAADPMNDAVSMRTRYFEEFGFQPLAHALRRMIQTDQAIPAERARPYRICLSLMDRWEIGGLIVPEIFLPVINSVQKYEKQSTVKEEFKEVLRSACVFFDGVESGLIWGEILALLAEALAPGKLPIEVRIEKLGLVRFILANFNVREEEMLVIHAPTATLAIVTMIRESILSKSNTTTLDSSTSELTALSLGVANDLVDLVPERAYLSRPSTMQSETTTHIRNIAEMKNGDILKAIRMFYVQDQGNLDISEAPFSSDETSQLLLRGVGDLMAQSLSGSLSSADVAAKSRLLVALLNKAPRATTLDTQMLLESSQAVLMGSSIPAFAAFTSIVSFVTTLHARSYIRQGDLSAVIDSLVKVAWYYLSPSFPKYHVETVRALWQLQMALSLSNHEVEAAICDQIIGSENATAFSRGHADTGKRFSILWTHMVLDYAGHLDRRGSKTAEKDTKNIAPGQVLLPYEVMLSRPLFLVLDALLDERTQMFVTVRTWLQTLSGVEKLFHLFVTKFAGFPFLKAVFVDEDNSETSPAFADKDEDLNQCLYYLQKLSNVLRWSSTNAWAALAHSTISTDKLHPELYRISGHDGEISLQEFFVHVCLCVIGGGETSPEISLDRSELHRIALTVLHQILLSPFSSPLSELRLEHKLIELLHVSLDGPDPFLQVSLLDVVFASLKLDGTTPISPPSSPIRQRRISSIDFTNASKTSLKLDAPPALPPPPPALIKCLQAGFSSSSSRSVLDSWMSFLAEVLPFYSESIFQVLIPLVETLCGEVSVTFAKLQMTFQGAAIEDQSTPESTLISLLNGLEQVLARGHERLLKDEASVPAVKGPEQPQGFFGNMVSGVFSSDAPQTRSQTANNRLTVLLSFQDAVKMSFLIWSWGGAGFQNKSQDVESVSSFNYTSLRMRNRARRLLEHLFAAEPLECLETVVAIWQQSQLYDKPKATTVINLLHVLDGSRPKHTIPAIFDAIYSRTSPGALDPSRKSTLTSELQDIDLVAFLVQYARSLEDDAMDEIWVDCMTFLRDILTNPFPHRQILPGLLQFASIIGEKVDNTNFGEQKKMRRDLGDLFLRLLTATFTTKPMGFTDVASVSEKQPNAEAFNPRADDIVGVLASLTPNLNMVLVEPERVLLAANTISASVVGPSFRSKIFPENVNKTVLELLYQVARLPGTQKAWKKDLSDAFNDARFFSNSVTLVESDWLPLLRLWSLSDKERMPELLSRLTPPTTAGIVFGVGATSARLEADRKTQLNLRRIATLLLAAADDTFVTELTSFEIKIVELLAATTTSSPSSTTRAEIFMVLRALALKISPVHLAPLWPIINAELQTVISSVVAPDHSQASETYNSYSLLQACKLLDTLLCIAPDDFQLHEWLYITDTVDSVYRPADYQPVGLVDELAEELGSLSTVYTEHGSTTAHQNNSDKSLRRPLIGSGGVNCDDVNFDRKDDVVGKILRPFFSQLSIFAFERTYDMGEVDWDTLRKGLLEDLFDEKGIVKAF